MSKLSKNICVLLFLIFLSTTRAYVFHGAAMAPNTLKGWVVASDTGLVFHTPDCGLTWENQSFLTSRVFADIFFLNAQKGWICSYDQGFVFYTDNGGINWVRVGLGLAKVSSRIFFVDDSCGWMTAGHDNVFGRTRHGGLLGTWEQICLNNPPFPYDTTFMWGTSFVDSLRGWFCAGRFPEYRQEPPPGDTWFTRGQGYIAKSTDGGLNWQLLKRDTIYDFFDIKFLDSLNGFVVGGNDRTMSAVMMRTQDGGNTWQPVTIPAQAKYLRALEFVDNNHAWAVGHRGTILHSDDGGNTWATQVSPVDTTLYDIDFSDSIHGLIAGDGCVLYTHDGGNIWHIANVSIEEEIASRSPRNDNVTIFPNPFTNTATVRYVVPISGQIKLELYNIAGKSIKILTNDYRKVGTYTTKLLGNKLANGIYFLRYENAVNQSVIKVIIK